MVQAGVPVVYRSGSGNAITNYDFLDVITGRGILTLYGGDISINGTKTYVLTPNQFYSQDGFTLISANAGTLDFSFDMELGEPITIEGDAIINAPFRVQNSAGETVTATFLVKKVDAASVVTVLISGACSQVVNTAAGGQVNQLVRRLAIPRTTIKGGETLRVQISGAGAVVAKNTDWAHDPKNRGTINTDAIGYETSQFAIQLPVVVDL